MALRIGDRILCWECRKPLAVINSLEKGVIYGLCEFICPKCEEDMNNEAETETPR